MARRLIRPIGPMPRGVGGVGRQFDVWPLDQFSAWDQACIAVEAQGDRPPSRWLDFELGQMPSRAWYEWHWQRGIDPDDATRRPAISRALRRAVYERDGHRCLHCGAMERLSLDHIYPYSLGGEDTYENLQTLCKPCNSRKGVRVHG